MIRLQQERLDRHLTAEDLSEQSGVSPRAIRRIEAGQASAHVGTLAKLSTALDVPASQLLLPVVSVPEDSAA